MVIITLIIDYILRWLFLDRAREYVYEHERKFNGKTDLEDDFFWEIFFFCFRIWLYSIFIVLVYAVLHSIFNFTYGPQATIALFDPWIFDFEFYDYFKMKLGFNYKTPTYKVPVLIDGQVYYYIQSGESKHVEPVLDISLEAIEEIDKRIRASSVTQQQFKTLPNWFNECYKKGQQWYDELYYYLYFKYIKYTNYIKNYIKKYINYW